MRRPDPFTLLCALVDRALAGSALDSELAAAVLDPRQPWPRLIRLSGVHLLTPVLGDCLEGLLNRLPPELGDYLEDMRAAACARNAGLRADLGRAVALLNEAGIEPVLLKGALRLHDGLFPGDGWRFMHDLDLLVRPAELELAAAALAGLGWPPLDAEPGQAAVRHDLVLMRPDGGTRLELHTAALEAPHDRLLPAPAVVARGRPVTRDGVRFLEPGAEDQIIHLVLHAQLQHAHLATGRLLLRDLVELALLVRRHGPASLEAARARLQAQGAAGPLDHAWLLARACLPRTARHAIPAAPGIRLLAARTLVLQRHPGLLQLLGPLGQLGAMLLGKAGAVPDRPAGWEGLVGMIRRELATFRSKTSW